MSAKAKRIKDARLKNYLEAKEDTKKAILAGKKTIEINVPENMEAYLTDKKALKKIFNLHKNNKS